MTCRHWWKLETPAGPTVRGVCKFCHETRDFKASEPDRSPVKTNIAIRPIERTSVFGRGGRASSR